MPAVADGEPTGDKEQKDHPGQGDSLERAVPLGAVSRAGQMRGSRGNGSDRFQALYDQGGALALPEIRRRKPIWNPSDESPRRQAGRRMRADNSARANGRSG